MSRLFSISKQLTACLCALVFTSCLDTREEVWINADASGAARFQIAMPLATTKLHGGEAGVKKMIEDYLNETTVFSSYSLNTSSEDDRLKIDLAVTFDNALDLRKATTGEAFEKLPSASAEMMGHTEVEFQGLSLAFSRRTELYKAIPGAVFFPKSQLQGHSITTIIHLPEAATANNATSTENGNRTLIWTTPLETAFSKPMETSFTMPIPIPWFAISLVVTLLIIMISALTYYILRRRARRRNATA